MKWKSSSTEYIVHLVLIRCINIKCALISFFSMGSNWSWNCLFYNIILRYYILKECQSKIAIPLYTIKDCPLATYLFQLAVRPLLMPFCTIYSLKEVFHWCHKRSRISLFASTFFIPPHVVYESNWHTWLSRVTVSRCQSLMISRWHFLWSALLSAAWRRSIENIVTVFVRIIISLSCLLAGSHSGRALITIRGGRDKLTDLSQKHREIIFIYSYMKTDV